MKTDLITIELTPTYPGSAKGSRTVPKWVADDLIRQGHAYALGKEDKPAQERVTKEDKSAPVRKTK